VIAQVGATDAAYFYIVWTIATSLNLVPMSIAISHTVESAIDHDNLIAQSRQALLHMLRLVVPITVVTIMAAPWILRLFGPGYAQAGTPLLSLMALGVIPYGVTVLYFSFARVTTKLRGVIFVQVFLSVAILTGASLMVPRFGITGVGVAWIASQAVVAAVILATALRPVVRRGRRVMPKD
jgi:O-antigen/teichoic acid export membrane protein